MVRRRSNGEEVELVKRWNNGEGVGLVNNGEEVGLVDNGEEVGQW